MKRKLRKLKPGTLFIDPNHCLLMVMTEPEYRDDEFGDRCAAKYVSDTSADDWTVLLEREITVEVL